MTAFALSCASVALTLYLTTGAAMPVSEQDTATDNSDVEVLQLRENFYMIAGGGGNIGVQVGKDGVVVVDAGSAPNSSAVIAAIQNITTQPIRYLINTTADPDHVGGNEAVASAGETLFTRLGGRGLAADFHSGGASIVSHENVLGRMAAPTGETAPFPFEAWPTETFHQIRWYIYLNGEGIEVLHQPGAHTDGDAFVFFRRSDVVVAGDVYDTTRFPVIDVERGGSIQGEIAALNRLVDLAIPSVPIVSREAGTLVIPGHGRVSDQLDVVEYRDMVTIIHDRIRDLIDAGLTLREIQATTPTRGYTRRYGSETGEWTTEDFVEAIYRSLTEEQP